MNTTKFHAVFLGLCMSVTSYTNASIIDTAAPELLGLTITPNAVDVSSSEQTLEVSYNFSDDISGLNYIGLSFFDSQGDYAGSTHGYTQFGDYLVSGDSHNGIIKSEFTIPQFSAEGEYTYALSIEDIVGNSTYIEYDELVNMDFGGQLSVTSNNPDTTSPELLGLTITPNAIDVSSSEQTLEVTYNFSDDISGLNYIGLSFFDSQGDYAGSTHGYTQFGDYLVSGDSHNGIIMSEFTIPQFSAEGEYTYALSIEDIVGNSTYIEYDELVNMGFGNQLHVGYSVPEPSTISIMALSFLGLFRKKLRRKNTPIVEVI